MADTTLLTNVESTALWLDIDDIVNNKDKNNISPSIDISAILHNEEFDLDSSDLLVISNMVVSRDYATSIGDYIEITLRLPLGLYLKKIYPYLHNTELSLSKDERNLIKGKPVKRLDRYKAVFLKDRNASLPTHKPGTMEDLNQIGFINLVLQLIDRSVETLRIKTTSGAFDKTAITRQSSPNFKIVDFLHSVIEQEASKVLVDGKTSIESIDIDPPDNTEPLEGIVIPSGTKVLNLPTFIQERSAGIYNTGIGTYIQPYKNKETLFIYKLYDGSKYKINKEKIIFYVPLTGNYSVTKYTYSYNDNTLRVVTEPNNNIANFKESPFMSGGSGIRMSQANSFMKKPVEMTDKGPKFVRHLLNTEIAVMDRKDNLNYAPVDRQNSISGNIFNKLSKINKTMGSMLRLVWHNADYELIYPGAPCKIATSSLTSETIELFGVILKVDVTINGDSAMSSVAQSQKNTFDVTCIIDIFIYNESSNTEKGN